MVQDITDCSETEEITAALLDVEKVFDKLHQAKFLYRIQVLKFPEEMLQLIFSCLGNKTLQVQFKDSNQRHYIKRLMCSVLVSILYAVYSSDFLCRAGSKLSQHADDTHVLQQHRTTNHRIITVHL